MGDFRDLKAWQHARTLAVLSKTAIARLPIQERFALADQWRRASYSVVLNIAEGASRRGTKEFRRYLDIARSSLHEVEAIIELVVALGYLRLTTYDLHLASSPPVPAGSNSESCPIPTPGPPRGFRRPPGP